MEDGYLALSWTLFVQGGTCAASLAVAWQGWAWFWFPCCLLCFLHAVLSQATYIPPVNVGGLTLKWFRSKHLCWEFTRVALLFGHYLLMGFKIYTGVDRFGKDFELYHDWTFFQSLQFIIATMSSVGYGDLAPKPNDAARRMTIFYAVLGLLVYSIITVCIVRTFSAVHASLCARIHPECWQPTLMQTSATYIFKLYLVFCLFQLSSAWVYKSLEDWTFETAIYHTIITATTIGYGDLLITSDLGRRWSGIHMLLSTCFLATIINFLHTLPVHFKIEKLANMKPDEQMLRSLSSNGTTVTETEYLVGMLKKADLIDSRALDLLIRHFRDLDNTGAGEILVQEQSHPSINEVKLNTDGLEGTARNVVRRTQVTGCLGLTYFWFGEKLGYASFISGSLRIVSVLAIRACKPRRTGFRIALVCSSLVLFIEFVIVGFMILGILNIKHAAVVDTINFKGYHWEGQLEDETQAMICLVLIIEILIVLLGDVPLFIVALKYCNASSESPLSRSPTNEIPATNGISITPENCETMQESKWRPKDKVVVTL
jgi:hypothetical protein